MQKITIAEAGCPLPSTMREKRFLSPQEAAQFLTKIGLKTTKTTLDTWVSRGGSPPFLKWGYRRVYEEGTLLAWAEARCGKPRFSSSQTA